ncbi:hypothetical protein DVH05_005611 [Phytophthora capsici]|nr:hypothetical protein DVH05_005611 [Phytophthora capsici]
MSFFVPLVAPMIESASHAALVEWKRRRKERVVQYFWSSRQVIEEHGWCKIFMDQEVAYLEPQALREEIESILAYQNRTARSDEKVLFKIILEKDLEL